MKKLIKDTHLKSAKFSFILLSSLMLVGCFNSSSTVDEADDTNDTVIVDTNDSTDTNTSVDTNDTIIVDSNDTIESNETITYFDVHFPIDSVDYNALSVNDVNLSEGAMQLAAQCAQCHGTYGVAAADWPDLWGSGRKIARWMKDYQSIEDYIDNVMHLHALAYTDEEVQLIKEYYENVTYTGGL